MATSLAILSLIVSMCYLLSPASSYPTAPAFVWSNHRSVGLRGHQAVEYRVLSPQALVDTLLEKLGWSTLLCNSDAAESDRLHAVVAFIGNELYSEDVGHNGVVDSSPVLRILKEHFTTSSYSLALPYISISTEAGGILNMLISSIENSCNFKSRPGKTLIMGSCFKGTFNPKSAIMTEGIELVATVEDLKDFLSSRKATRKASEIDVVLTCPVPKDGLEEAGSEGDMLATVLSTLRQSGTNNAILYASDPRGYMDSHRDNSRVLASNTTSTSTTTCDEICETVKGVYEGIIVAVTLLIILISGLCCMMGIDTPSRFESPQD